MHNPDWKLLFLSGNSSFKAGFIGFFVGEFKIILQISFLRKTKTIFQVDTWTSKTKADRRWGIPTGPPMVSKGLKGVGAFDSNCKGGVKSLFTDLLRKS